MNVFVLHASSAPMGSVLASLEDQLSMDPLSAAAAAEWVTQKTASDPPAIESVCGKVVKAFAGEFVMNM